VGYVYQLIAAPLFLVSLLFLVNGLLSFGGSEGTDIVGVAQGVLAVPVFLIALKLLRDGRRKIKGA
jgi:hypothetical protein